MSTSSFQFRLKGKTAVFIDWAMKHVLVMSTRGHVARELLERAKFVDVRQLKHALSQ